MKYKYIEKCLILWYSNDIILDNRRVCKNGTYD